MNLQMSNWGGGQLNLKKSILRQSGGQFRLNKLNCFNSVIKNIGEILYSFSYFDDS